jgi:hypothetical protein
MLLIASLSFWECSGNNPAGNSNPSLSADNNTGNANTFGNGNDNSDDSDIGTSNPPDLPNIEGGKYADSSYAQHLRIDNSKSVYLEASASIVDAKGGSISLNVDGKAVALYFQPFGVYSETNINMVIEKGKNAWNEDLYIFYFGPDGLSFGHYPILEMQVQPYFNDRQGSTYELYCWAAGSWLKYYSLGSNPQGLLKFYIPHLSTYALLVRNSMDADNLEL